MGAVQLSQFGAAIYVADLVGIGMVREMGAMMTAIIMSGRTGAAFAAKLGTMKVTQEIDALTTMGISPLEFLVLPRVLALVLMMPLLCLYADFVGILGGAFVGVTMLDLAPRSYFRETISTLTFANLLGGLFKATVYGALIAVAGCLRGFQCGNSSSAVGDAATQAVVTVDRDGGRSLRHLRGRLQRAGNLRGALVMATAAEQRPDRSNAEAHITVRNVTMAYGSFVLMRDLNFVVRRGDIFVIMGGSGCGKSTLLRAPDRTQGAGQRRNILRRRQLHQGRARGARTAAAPVRNPVSGRRALEFDDAGRERRVFRSASSPT